MGKLVRGRRQGGKACRRKEGKRKTHHLLQPHPRNDIPLMNQPIQQLGAALNDTNIRHPSVTFLVVFRFDIEDHFHRFFVEGDQACESGEVEIVFDEIFGYFAEVFVAGEGAEPVFGGRREGEVNWGVLFTQSRPLTLCEHSDDSVGR
jgi:hypothetical protein